MTIYEALCQVQTGEHDYSICAQLSDILDRDHLFWEWREVWDEWDGFSGDFSYPVTGGRDAYCISKSYWTGGYGADRKELLEWLKQRALEDNV